jgi:nickel/cobalt exporter
VAAALLNASAAAMRSTVNLIEILSYALIVLIGLRLLWVKGRAFVDAARSLRRPAALSAAVTAPAEAQAAAKGCGHMHGPGHARAHDAAHGHAHCHAGNRQAQDSHACAWDHAHAPEPQELAGAGGWRRGFAAIVAVGLRPCSGAVLVLVFALAQGLFWAGVVSTFLMGLGTAATVAAIATLAVAAKGWARRFADRRSGQGMLAMRAVEVAAAAVLIAFGALLLTGYLASERMVGI